MQNKYSKLKVILTLIIFFSFFGLVGSSEAATYYIKTGGNDGSAGTSDATAWASLDKIRTSISSGDTVYLNKGDTWTSTANESYASLHFDGKSNITIDSYGTGSKPLIDNTEQVDTTPSTLDPNWCVLQFIDSTNISVSNIEMRGALNTMAVFLDNSTAIDITGCDVSGKGYDGSSVTESLMMAKGNSVFNIVDCLITMYGVAWNSYYYTMTIEWKYGSYGNFQGNEVIGITGTTLKNVNSGSNYVSYWENNYIHGCDSRSASPKVIWIRGLSTGSGSNNLYVIRNNVIDLCENCPSGDTLNVLHRYTAYPYDVIIWFINNTIISDGVGENRMSANSSDYIYIHNNIFYDMNTGADLVENASNFSIRNNIFYDVASILEGSTPGTDSGNFKDLDGSLYDPNFLDINNLTAGAALTVLSTDAIDGGYGTAGSGYYPSTDYSGNARSMIDIGAFEYESFDITPPSYPTGLSVE